MQSIRRPHYYTQHPECQQGEGHDRDTNQDPFEEENWDAPEFHLDDQEVDSKDAKELSSNAHAPNQSLEAANGDHMSNQMLTLDLAHTSAQTQTEKQMADKEKAPNLPTAKATDDVNW